MSPALDDDLDAIATAIGLEPYQGNNNRLIREGEEALRRVRAFLEKQSPAAAAPQEDLRDALVAAEINDALSQRVARQTISISELTQRLARVGALGDAAVLRAEEAEAALENERQQVEDARQQLYETNEAHNDLVAENARIREERDAYGAENAKVWALVDAAKAVVAGWFDGGQINAEVSALDAAQADIARPVPASAASEPKAPTSAPAASPAPIVRGEEKK